MDTLPIPAKETKPICFLENMVGGIAIKGPPVVGRRQFSILMPLSQGSHVEAETETDGVDGDPM